MKLLHVTFCGYPMYLYSVSTQLGSHARFVLQVLFQGFGLECGKIRLWSIRFRSCSHKFTNWTASSYLKSITDSISCFVLGFSFIYWTYWILDVIGHSPWGFSGPILQFLYWVRSDVSLYKAPQAHVRIWCSLQWQRLVVTHQRMYEARHLPLIPCGVDSNVGFWPGSFRQLFGPLMSGQL